MRTAMIGLILIPLAGLLTGPAAADTTGLPATARTILDAPPYAGSSWAVRVVDTATGEVLVDENSRALLEPASVTKTFSVGAAWLKFGPDSKIVTPVVRQGKVKAGTLDGDLILVAKGDITMGGQTGKDGKVVFTNMDHNDANLLPGATIADNNPLAGLNKLAKQIKKSGIKHVDGDVIIDDRLWITQNLGVNDGPVSPIIINNNLIDVVAKPTSVGKPAKVRMRPEVAPWRVVNKVKTIAASKRGAIDITSPKNGVIELNGTIAADAAPQLKVEHFTDPSRFARTAFIEALQRAGVKVSANATAKNPRKELPSRKQVARLPKAAKLTGLPLEENGKYILKVSYNRGAQTMVCLLAASVGNRDCDAGFPVMQKVLSQAGLDTKQASLVDGSGLPGNYVTATSVTQLMEIFSKRPDALRWQNALPIMGLDGSVADVQKDSPAAGKVFAKTGTLGAADLLNQRFRIETKALGGYIDSKSGRRLAIAIIVNQAMFDDLDGVFAANEDLGKIATSLYEAY